MSTQNNNARNIDPEKVTAERLNGYAALFGCIALVGAYATTLQLKQYNQIMLHSR